MEAENKNHWVTSESAIAQCQEAIKIDPCNFKNYLYLAQVFENQGHFEAAIRTYRQAIAIVPECAQFLFNLGDRLLQAGETELARKSYYLATLAIYPDLAINLHFNPELTFGQHILWDPWLLKTTDGYRLFYLTGKRHVQPFWKQGQISAAISPDLKNWDYLGTVLTPIATSDWEADNLCAGSAYQEGNCYYLFYSASVYQADGVVQSIGLATSNDGVNWRRSPEPILKPDPRFYGGSIRPQLDGNDPITKIVQCRDPYILKEEKTGQYYMFFTAVVGRSRGKNPTYSGCVGVAVSDKIDGVYRCLPPACDPVISDSKGSIFYELERPQVIFKNNRYYLFFSCWTRLINPAWLETVDRRLISDSSLYCYVSDRLTGPYRAIASTPVVSGSEKTELYGTQLMENLNGDSLFAYGWYCKSKTLEISPRFPAIWTGDRWEIIA
jgi:beta-fructofuranosidase